jgi:WhiB family redox-sensing transcriptional regulator
VPALTEPAGWRDDAACRHHDPELFFPEGTTGPASTQVNGAKLVCEACPVRSPCLGYALSHGLGYGIWGGTTEDERRAIRRRGVRALPSHAGNVALGSWLGLRRSAQ